MILTILGVAIISLILILVGHSVWTYFYDMWISPHISSSPPAISPYIISVNEPTYSGIFGLGMGSGSGSGTGSDSTPIQDNINISGTSNIAELQIDLSSEYGTVPQGLGMGGTEMETTTIPVSDLPHPEMEVSKRNLKELFSNLKKEGSSGGVSSLSGGLSGSTAFMNASTL